jgi:hypothetical protein
VATKGNASAKPRDYKAEYAKRNERAKAQGYRSYTRKRKAQDKIRETIEEVDLIKDIMDDLISDIFGDLEDDEREVSLIWQLFRQQYTRGSN